MTTALIGMAVILLVLTAWVVLCIRLLELAISKLESWRRP